MLLIRALVDGLIKKQKFLVVLYLVLAPLEAASSVLFAYLIEPVTSVASEGNTSLFVYYTLLILFVALINCLIAYATAVTYMKLVKRYEKMLRADTFSRITGQQMEAYDKQNTNAYISLLDVDVKLVSESFVGNVLSIYSIIWSFLFSLLAVAYLDWKVVVLVLVFSFCSVIMPRLFQESLDKSTEDYASAFSKYMVKTKDILEGLTILKTFRIKERIQSDFEAESRKLTKHDIEKEMILSRISYLSMGLSQLTFLGVVVLGAYMVLKGKMTIGYVLSLSQMIGGIIAPFELLSGKIAGIKSTGVIYEKLFALLECKGVGNAPVEVAEKDIISIQNVQFSYSEDVPLLENFSFEFDAKKKYIMVGPSGSGKSTIAKLIMKLYSPIRGKICWNNQDITSINEKDYYGLLAYNQQEVYIFDDTLEFNITLGRKCNEEVLNKIIRECGLLEVVNRLENGVQTVLHEKGHILSGGERQRIGIARCMVEQPRMIIMDEAFANLDEKLAVQMEQLVISQNHCGCILITHQLHSNILKQCDCVIVMSRGKIEKFGTYEELRQSGVNLGVLQEAENV